MDSVLPQREAARGELADSDKKGVAIDLLKLREGDVAKGVPVTPKIGRLRFEEAAQRRHQRLPRQRQALAR